MLEEIPSATHLVDDVLRWQRTWDRDGLHADGNSEFGPQVGHPKSAIKYHIASEVSINSQRPRLDHEILRTPFTEVCYQDMIGSWYLSPNSQKRVQICRLNLVFTSFGSLGKHMDRLPEARIAAIVSPNLIHHQCPRIQKNTWSQSGEVQTLVWT